MFLIKNNLLIVHFVILNGFLITINADSKDLYLKIYGRTDYNNEQSWILCGDTKKNPSPYTYEMGKSVALKCEQSESLNGILEWHDVKNNITFNSKSRTNTLTYYLNNLDMDDDDSEYICKSSGPKGNLSLNINLKLSETSNSDSDEFFHIIDYNLLVSDANTSMELGICNNTIKIPEDRKNDTHINCYYLINIKYNEKKRYKKRFRLFFEPTDITAIPYKLVNGENDVDPDSSLLPLGIAVGVVSLISLIIMAIICSYCYKKVKKRKINSQPQGPAVLYAEIETNRAIEPNLPIRNDPPYAKIVGVLARK